MGILKRLSAVHGIIQLFKLEETLKGRLGQVSCNEQGVFLSQHANALNHV